MATFTGQFDHFSSSFSSSFLKHSCSICSSPAVSHPQLQVTSNQDVLYCKNLCVNSRITTTYFLAAHIFIAQRRLKIIIFNDKFELFLQSSADLYHSRALHTPNLDALLNETCTGNLCSVKVVSGRNNELVLVEMEFLTGDVELDVFRRLLKGDNEGLEEWGEEGNTKKKLMGTG